MGCQFLEGFSVGNPLPFSLTKFSTLLKLRAIKENPRDHSLGDLSSPQKKNTH